MHQEISSESSSLNSKYNEHVTKIFSKYHTQVNSIMQNEFPAGNTKINTMLKYFLGWTDPSGHLTNKPISGKALRPILCILACNAAGGAVQKAIPAAIPLELIHNFSLIHDDIQDKDKLRHNRPTIWALWGNPKALVAGNNLRIIADITMNKLIATNIPLNKCLSINYILTQACLEMIEGQYLDIKYEGQASLTKELYLEMISKKTGALITAAINIGVNLATENQDKLKAFNDFGKYLGFVFQITDDILGIWGTESKTGKPVGADIIRKKNSLPIIMTISNTTYANQETIKEIYNKQKISNRDLNEILNIMDQAKSKQHCTALATKYYDKALDSISKIPMTSQSRKEIESLALFLTKRQH